MPGEDPDQHSDSSIVDSGFFYRVAFQEMNDTKQVGAWPKSKPIRSNISK